MTVFFGERWDAPRVDNAHQVLTPVGTPCLYCQEPVEDGDRGVLMPCADLVNGELVSTVQPAHMECDLRSATGNIDHLQGRCSCYLDGAPHGARPYRDEAREVLAWVNRERAKQGHGPL